MKNFEQFVGENPTRRKTKSEAIDRELDAKAKALIAKHEEDVNSLSIIVNLPGSKDKIAIKGENSGTAQFIKLYNPNRGGPYYRIDDAEALKKAFNQAIDQAVSYLEKAEAEYKKGIDDLIYLMKQKQAGK